MSTPREASTIRAQIATHLPHLTRPQQRGLAEWVLGVLLAGTGCQTRVAAALTAATHTPVATVQQRLREWLRDGADKACPGATQVELAPCFAALLRWVLGWWPPTDPLPLALDATFHHDQLVAIVLSVSYRGTALPIAWAIGPANRTTFPWKAPTQQLVAALAGIVPPERLVLVTADRGFWSPALWETVCGLGWHPLFRVRPDAVFCPDGGRRVVARSLVRPGEQWTGTGVLYRHRSTRCAVTLVACWAAHGDRSEFRRLQIARLGVGAHPPPRSSPSRAARPGARHRHLAGRHRRHLAGNGRPGATLATRHPLAQPLPAGPRLAPAPAAPRAAPAHPPRPSPGSLAHRRARRRRDRRRSLALRGNPSPYEPMLGEVARPVHVPGSSRKRPGAIAHS